MPLYDVDIYRNSGYVSVELNFTADKEGIALYPSYVTVTVDAADSNDALVRALFLLAQYYANKENN